MCRNQGMQKHGEINGRKRRLPTEAGRDRNNKVGDDRSCDMCHQIALCNKITDFLISRLICDRTVGS